MKFSFRTFAIQTSILLIAISNVCLRPACADDLYATSIKQIHSFFGKSLITFTANALKIDNTNGLGFVLITKAPAWQVDIFRNNDKTIFSESFSDFVKFGLVSESQLPRKGTALVSATNSNSQLFMGFSIVHVKTPGIFEFLPLPNGTATQIAWVASLAFKTLYAQGLPLTEMSRGERNSVCLKTISIKRTPVPGTLFDIPTDYARVNSLRDVVFGLREQKGL